MFKSSSFGIYEAKLHTERGVMSGVLFYNAGEDLPFEIHAKFRVNGRDYFYLRSSKSQENAWLLDVERNHELFAEIKRDWQRRCLGEVSPANEDYLRPWIPSCSS